MPVTTQCMYNTAIVHLWWVLTALASMFNVHEGARSQGGIWITLGGGGVLFKSYKIKVVAKSVAEARK